MPDFVPFWDGDGQGPYTVDRPGPYGGYNGKTAQYGYNGTYQTGWDTAKIKGLQLPGIVTVSPTRARHLWTIQAPGIAPIPIRAGYEPLKFQMTIKVWTPGQWLALQPIMWAMEPVWIKAADGTTQAAKDAAKAKEQANAAFDVYHPILATFSVSSCICEVLGPFTGDGPKTLALTFLEYRRGKSSVATTDQSIVNEKFNAEGLANQQVKAQNGKVTTVTPTQGPQPPPSQNVSLRPTP